MSKSDKVKLAVAIVALAAAAVLLGWYYGLLSVGSSSPQPSLPPGVPAEPPPTPTPPADSMGRPPPTG